MQILTFLGPQVYVDIVKRSKKANIEHDSMIEFDCYGCWFPFGLGENKCPIKWTTIRLDWRGWKNRQYSPNGGETW